VLRRSLLLLPLVAGAAATLGVRYHHRPVVVVTVCVVAALVLGVGLGRVSEKRIRAVADRVGRFAEGDELDPLDPTGSRQWRRLLRGLNAVAVSLRDRFAELAGERARVERLLDSLPTAVLLFAEDGLAYANPTASELFNVSGGDEVRTPLQILGAEGLAGALAEARETGRAVEVEVQRNDRELVARASVTAEGEVALVVSDLTDARRIEAVRRDFVTNASHELKTPVAGIQALSESLDLAFDRDPDRARTMIGRLRLEAERLGHLVRELLDLARLEEDAATVARQRVDIAQLVRVQAHRLARLGEEREVTIRTDCPAPASVVALPEDMRLVVANLLENAVQYNQPGGEVVATVRRADDSTVVLEVTDTGIGIPDAEVDRVFERFYRIDKARSRQIGGTGLGLSIVRHAVQRHGGQISLRSVLGSGSTFTVTLPVEGAGPSR
jgi:signal transduction histidine kinase